MNVVQPDEALDDSPRALTYGLAPSKEAQKWDEATWERGPQCNVGGNGEKIRNERDHSNERCDNRRRSNDDRRRGYNHAKRSYNNRRTRINRTRGYYQGNIYPRILGIVDGAVYVHRNVERLEFYHKQYRNFDGTWCFLLQMTSSTCAPGLFCEIHPGSGVTVCMEQHNEIGTEGIIVGAFFGACIAGCIAVLVGMCLKDKRARKRFQNIKRAKILRKMNTATLEEEATLIACSTN
ncbi:hypothetical protein FoTM2_002990 [Fusarium oxysporum f. sp. vasinfectum]|nr:hypothetical protein FoTM2_002990 [Fusarium oxysporum f. sp. vasinfectum]